MTVGPRLVSKGSYLIEPDSLLAVVDTAPYPSGGYTAPLPLEKHNFSQYFIVQTIPKERTTVPRHDCVGGYQNGLV